MFWSGRRTRQFRKKIETTAGPTDLLVESKQRTVITPSSPPTPSSFRHVRQSIMAMSLHDLALQADATLEVGVQLWGDVMLGDESAHAGEFPEDVDLFAVEAAAFHGAPSKASKARAAAPKGGARAHGHSAARKGVPVAPPKGGSRFAALSLVDPDDVEEEVKPATAAPWAPSAAPAAAGAVAPSLSALIEEARAEAVARAAAVAARIATAPAAAGAGAGEWRAAPRRMGGGGGGRTAGGRDNGCADSRRGVTGGGRGSERQGTEPVKPKTLAAPTNLGHDLDTEIAAKIEDDSSIYTLYIGNLPRRNPARCPKDWDEKRDGKWDPWFKFEQEVGELFREATKFRCHCPWVMVKGGTPCGALVEFDSPDDARDARDMLASSLKMDERVLRVELAKSNYKPLAKA